MPPDIILHKVLEASVDEPGIAPHPSVPDSCVTAGYNIRAADSRGFLNV